MLYKFLSIRLAQQKLIYILQHSRGFLAYHQVLSEAAGNLFFSIWFPSFLFAIFLGRDKI